MKLRYYQEEAINSIFQWFADGKESPLAVLATGTGKSLVIADMIKRILDAHPSERIICCIDTKELVLQNYETFLKLMPFAPVGLFSASLNKKQNTQIIFASIQSIYKHAVRIGKVDLLICDECFTGDTKIKTITGEKRIDHVRLGDIILNATGCGEVTAISKKPTKKIYIVRLSNGEEIKCTGNHPFLSKQGWIESKNLVKGQKLFSTQDMPTLWKGISSKNLLDWDRERKTLCRSKNLLKILLKEDAKSNAQQKINRKNDEHINKDRTQTIYSWWKWYWANESSKNGFGNAWGRVGVGVTNINKDDESKKYELSNLLQNRRSERKEKNCNRNRWKNSLWKKKKDRRKKGQFFDEIRVESVTTEERKSYRNVYNLQVDGHPTFFANGILVHNCHMISDDNDTMWNNFIRLLRMINPQIRIVGLTATPYRMSSGLLHTGENAIFKGVCYEYGIKQGISDGFLSEIISKGMATKLNIDGVGKRGGEYIESQLQKAVNVDEITKSAIKEVIEFGKDRKSWLGFASGIEHAKAIKEEILKYGISCEMVDGSTPSKERDEIVRKFKNNEIKCLVNNSVFSKGFDAPCVDMIFCMRPTNSPVFFLQMVGRGFRISDGKENCLLLDFAQNLSRFGTIDTITFKDKKRKDDEDGVPPMKECPKCSSIVFAGLRECPDCGHEFPEPEREKINSSADNAPVLSGQEHFEEWIIDGYEIEIHKKPSKPDSLRISYYSGMLNKISEYHCFEHGGYATTKAQDFWRKNTDIKKCSAELDYELYSNGIPKTTETAYFLRHCINIPQAIRVKKEGRFFRIIARSEQELNQAEEAHLHKNSIELDDSEIPF